MLSEMSQRTKLNIVMCFSVLVVFFVGISAIVSFDSAIAAMYPLITNVEPATPSEIGALYEKLNHSAAILVIVLPMSVIAIVLGALSLKSA